MAKGKIVGFEWEQLGYFETLSDSINWEYTGDDPDNEISAYFSSVENKDAYQFTPEELDITEGDTTRFNNFYVTQMADRVEEFDRVFAVKLIFD